VFFIYIILITIIIKHVEFGKLIDYVHACTISTKYSKSAIINMLKI